MATISDKRGVGGRAGRAGLGWLGGRYDGAVGAADPDFTHAPIYNVVRRIVLNLMRVFTM